MRDLSGSGVSFPNVLDITFRERPAPQSPVPSVERPARVAGTGLLLRARRNAQVHSAARGAGGRPVGDASTATARVGMETAYTVSLRRGMKHRGARSMPAPSLAG